METCVHCEKIFTKRGVNRHINKCKKNFSVIPFSVIPFTQQSNTVMNITNRIFALPPDCMSIIQEYLMYKETFVSYKRFFANHINYALVCKIFYNDFMLSSNKYKLLSNEEERLKIPRRIVLSTYGLSDADMDTVYGNKKHRQICETDPIYSMTNIMAYAYKKHGTYDRYISEKTRISVEKKRQRDIQMTEMKERKGNLTMALQKHRLVLREDSTLCNNYIRRNQGNVDEIVDTMIEMDFLFRYTNYASILRNHTSNYVYESRMYDDFGYDPLSNTEKIVLSRTSKKLALKEWCAIQKTCDNAIHQKYLPSSLYGKVNDCFSQMNCSNVGK